MSKHLKPVQIAEICRLYKAGRSAYELADLFSCSSTSIYYHLDANGISRRRFRKLKPSQVTEIINRYQSGETTVDLSVAYGVSDVSIGGLLKRRNIPIRSRKEAARRYVCDHHAFDAITEESAYWIGFLMADGCISKSANSSPELLVRISAQDREHLFKFRSFLCSTHPIRDFVQRNKYPSCRIGIRSTELCDALAKYGIKPNKSLTAKVIGLESNRHFWRGCVDGDGYIGIVARPEKHHKPNVILELTGAKPLILQFAHFVKQQLDIDMMVQSPPHTRAYIARTSCNQAIRLIDFLYSDCTIALDRKLELARITQNI